MIEFTCECGKNFHSPEKYRGRKGVCPECQRKFVIGGEDQSTTVGFPGDATDSDSVVSRGPKTAPPPSSPSRPADNDSVGYIQFFLLFGFMLVAIALFFVAIGSKDDRDPVIIQAFILIALVWLLWIGVRIQRMIYDISARDAARHAKDQQASTN